jgi:AraC-like DNA-binding protein
MHVKRDAFPRPLAPYVSALHYHEGNLDAGLERVLPVGNIHLMVNLHADEIRVDHRASGGAVLQGPQARAHVVDFSVLRAFIVVDFKPGGAARLFDVPLADACDHLVDLADVWGPGEASLRERILDAQDVACKLAVVAAALERHLDRTPPDASMIRAATALGRGAPVTGVASQLGFLPGMFVRRFRAATGLTPKRFARLHRLQRVVGSANAAGGRPDWAAIAAAHGYVDQAHLIHDFRDLTGMTPTEYRPASPSVPNHVPVAIDRR